MRNLIVVFVMWMIVCLLFIGTASAMFTNSGYFSYPQVSANGCFPASATKVTGAYTNDTVHWWFTHVNASVTTLFDAVECSYNGTAFTNLVTTPLGLSLSAPPKSGGISAIQNQTARTIYISSNNAGASLRRYNLTWGFEGASGLSDLKQTTKSPNDANLANVIAQLGVVYYLNLTSQSVYAPISCPAGNNFVVPNVTDWSTNIPYGMFYANNLLYICRDSGDCIGFNYTSPVCAGAGSPFFSNTIINPIDNLSFSPCGGYLIRGVNQLTELAIGNGTAPIVCYDKSDGTKQMLQYFDGFYIFNQTYNPNTVQGALEPFTITFTYDGSIFYVVSASLIYNNTNWGGTQTSGGSIPTFSTNVIIPANSLTSTVNNTFYWNIILSNGTAVYSYNSSSNIQTVYPLGIDNCSTNTDKIFTLVSVNDEASDTPINSSTNPLVELDFRLSSLYDQNTFITYHSILSGSASTTNASVCIPNNLLNYSSFRIDGTVSYIADTYVQEFWYIVNGTLMKNSQNYDPFTSKNVTLRNLPLADSKTFLFTFYDENYLTHPNAVAIVYRKYIGDGVYKEVERGKFDNNGQTHLHLVEEDVIYEFAVTENGVLLYRTDDVNAVCLETPCSITINKKPEGGGATSDLTGLQNGTYLLTSNTTARTVTLSFNTVDVGTMELQVFQYDNSKPTDTLVGSNSITARQGTVQVTVPLIYGNTTYYAVVKHNSVFVNSQWLSFSESGYNYFGALGLFLAMLLILTLGLIAVSHGGWTIAFILLGFIIAIITKLINMDMYLFAWVVCLGGIVIYKLAMRRSI